MLPRTATQLGAGSFPGDLTAYLGLAVAVAGAAFLLTHFNYQDWLLWWKARNWPTAEATVVRVDPALVYRYQVNGQSHESSRIGIATGSGPTGYHAVDVRLSCFYNPDLPAEALLEREYEGWWWLPGAWLLAAFLLLQTLPAWTVAMWRWATYRPDPPLTWAQWFATFYENGAWSFTVIGLAALVPGLAMVVFVTAVPWWNWWQASQWQPAQCEIVRSAVRGWSGGGSSRSGSGGYLLDIEYRYLWGGRTYTSNRYSPWRLGGTEWLLQSTKEAGIEELQQRFAVGTRHGCFVAPDRPDHAFLSRDRDNSATYITSIGPFVALLGLIILCARR